MDNPVAQPGFRFLVIDDNTINLRLISCLLKAFHHTALVALDGETGIEAALRERPHLILCDIQLPGISGIEVALRLRDHPVTRGIPLVAFTALAMVGDRERILEAGFDGYISKPLDPASFVPTLERFLTLQRSATTLPSRSLGMPVWAANTRT
jgi:CheY-like chemotaxis protein